MSQYGRPDSTVTATNIAGGTYEAIDETTAVDTPAGTEFVYGNEDAAVTYEVGLSDVTDPAVGTGHTFRYRIVSLNGTTPSVSAAVYCTASLYEGTTLRKADTQKTTTASWVTYELTLSEAEANAITDYTNLRLRFVSPASGGSAASRRALGLSWAELEVPDAFNKSINVSDSVNVSESVTAWRSSHKIDVFDSITATENITSGTTPKQVNVFDSVTASEDITAAEQTTVTDLNIADVYDSINVSESIVSTSGPLYITGESGTFLDQSEGITYVGFGEWAGVRYRGQGFKTTGQTITKLGFDYDYSTYGLKAYIDTADANSIPDHAVGSELYSWEITVEELATWGPFTLPVPFPTTSGTQYVFYLAPWNTTTHAYVDNYRSQVYKNSNIYADGYAVKYESAAWGVSDAGNLDAKFSLYTESGPIDKVNVSEDITAETITPTEDLQISNVFDSVTATDVVDDLILNHFDINVYDSITATENLVAGRNFHQVSVFDPINVSEQVPPTVLETNLIVSVYDEDFVSESVIAGRNFHEVNIFDSISVSELDPPTILETNLIINVSDTVNVSEDIVAGTTPKEVIVFDSVTVTESLSFEQDLYNIDVFDSATATEEITSQENLFNLDVFDSVVVSEDITASRVGGGTAEINVNDSINVSENITSQAIPLAINVAQWYNQSWGYRQKITIDAGEVEADATDFPVYVRLGDLNASFHTNVNQTDARDIRVTKEDGLTELPREVISYDSTNDVGELYFKYTGTLSASEDTKVYIYYGNAGASDYADNATYGAENVWNSGYEAVYHLSETSGSAEDSTANAHDGTYNGTVPARNVGHQAGTYSQYFDGDHDRIAVPQDVGFEGTAVTMAAWFKRDGVQGAFNYPKIVSYGPPDPSPYGSYVLGINGDDISINLHLASDSTNYDITPDFDSSDATWYYCVGTHSGTAQELRVNASQIASASNTFTLGNFLGDGLGIGSTYAYEGNSPDFNDYSIKGYISEVRISNVARAATWTDTEYNNMSAPTTFYTAGAVEAAGGEPYVTVTEDITIETATGVTSLSVFDTVNVSEGVTAEENSYNISVFDSLTATESLSFHTISNTSVFDSVTVAEDITISETTGITEHDVNVFDGAEVSENLTIQLNLFNLSVFDSLAVSETTTQYLDHLELSVFDSVTATENITASLPSTALEINVFDLAEVADSTDSLYDDIAVSEDDSESLPQFQINVTENLAVSEGVFARSPLQTLSVFDSATASDSVSVVKISGEVSYDISVYDSIAVSEDTIATNNFHRISVSDSITAADSVRRGVVTGGWYVSGEEGQSWSDTTEASTTWTDTSESATSWN